ncbi:hypothetical protein [Loktanella sp. DSM 29012]|uniref:hypothetical protein n=1 Tax=Loktanella sp. DSM 29012 TaxID=1881056 RepID=UPI000B7F8F47|nr:hypothetical protein [Loktanella sp. DSM 29012]
MEIIIHYAKIFLRLWRGNPIRRAGFLTLAGGLAILVDPWSILRLVIYDLTDLNDQKSGLLEYAIGIFLVMVGLTIIIVEYCRANRPPNQDQLMLNKFLKKLPREVVNFIRDTQFANGLRLDRLQAVTDLADNWRGAEYHFRDPALQNAFEELLRGAQGLMSIVRLEMRPIELYSDFMLIRDGRDGNGSERPREIIVSELHTTSIRISKAYDTLILRAKELNLSLEYVK